MNTVTVPRVPKEAIGAIARLEGGAPLTINVEYNQLDALLKTTPVGGDVADSDTGLSAMLQPCFPGSGHSMSARRLLVNHC